jgi:transposase
MLLYGGIDLHANNSVIVLLNEQDKVIYRKRLSNDLPAILEQLDPYHAAIKGLVVESTYKGNVRVCPTFYTRGSPGI